MKEKMMPNQLTDMPIIIHYIYENNYQSYLYQFISNADKLIKKQLQSEYIKELHQNSIT